MPSAMWVKARSASRSSLPLYNNVIRKEKENMAEKTVNPASKLKLKNVKVVFYNPEDEGFGRSLTIDCTAEEVKKQIEDWVKTNNIGKDAPGVPKFKEYTPEGKTPTLQFAFKINDFTKYAGANGLSEKDLGYGATVDLIAQAFTYSNKFTSGKERVGQSLTAVVVRSAASTGSDADLNELLGDLGEEPESETEIDGVPF